MSYGSRVENKLHDGQKIFATCKKKIRQIVTLPDLEARRLKFRLSLWFFALDRSLSLTLIWETFLFHAVILLW